MTLASRQPVEKLSIRLARIACDLDEVANGLEQEKLLAADALLLSTPLLHLEIAIGRIRETLYELELHGQSPWPVAPESDRLAA